MYLCIFTISILDTADSAVEQCTCCTIHKFDSVIQLLQQIIRKTTLIEINLNEIKSLLEKTRSTNDDPIVTDVHLLECNMPLNDWDSFENFECFLKNEENMKKMVSTF